MLVGGFRAGAGKGLACANPVFGQEGSDPAADRPRPGAQIGVIAARLPRLRPGSIPSPWSGPGEPWQSPA